MQRRDILGIVREMSAEANGKEKILTFLQTHAVAVLSTVGHDNSPYAATIYIVADNDLNFYFLTKSDTKKTQNINHNNKAAITMMDTALPITLQTTGTIQLVKDPEKLLDMFIKIAEKNAHKEAGFSWPPPLAKLRGAGGLLMYKFIPSWMRLGDFSHTEDVTETTESIFHELHPQTNNDKE